MSNSLGVETALIQSSSILKVVYGYDFTLFSEEVKELGENEEGNLIIKLPLPYGTLLDL